MPLRKAEILFAGNELKGTYSNAKCSGVRRLREGIPLNKNLKKLDHASEESHILPDNSESREKGLELAIVQSEDASMDYWSESKFQEFSKFLEIKIESRGFPGSDERLVARGVDQGNNQLHPLEEIKRAKSEA